MTCKGHCRFGDSCQWSHQEQVVATAFYQHRNGKYRPPKPRGDQMPSLDQQKQTFQTPKGGKTGKGKGKGKGKKKGKGKGKAQSSWRAKPKGAVAAQADQPTGNGPASPFEENEDNKTLYAIVDQDQWQEDNEQWNEESWENYQEGAQDSGDPQKH